MDDLECSSFQKIIMALSDRMRHSYIFSMSHKNDSDHLKEKYGTSIVEFPEDFPSRLGNLSRHLTPSGDGYRLKFSHDLYDLHEGFVVYESLKQQAIAKDICRTFLEISRENAHIVDPFHFINVILTFIALSKRSNFSEEEEYRLLLVAKNNKAKQFELERNDGCRNLIYIKLNMPIEFKLRG